MFSISTGSLPLAEAADPHVGGSSPGRRGDYGDEGNRPGFRDILAQLQAGNRGAGAASGAAGRPNPSDGDTAAALREVVSQLDDVELREVFAALGAEPPPKSSGRPLLAEESLAVLAEFLDTAAAMGPKAPRPAAPDPVSPADSAVLRAPQPQPEPAPLAPSAGSLPAVAAPQPTATVLSGGPLGAASIELPRPSPISASAPEMSPAPADRFQATGRSNAGVIGPLVTSPEQGAAPRSSVSVKGISRPEAGPGGQGSVHTPTGQSTPAADQSARAALLPGAPSSRSAQFPAPFLASPGNGSTPNEAVLRPNAERRDIPARPVGAGQPAPLPQPSASSPVLAQSGASMPAPVQGAAAPAFPSVPATLSPNAMTVERDRPDPAATVNGKAPASPSTPAIAAPPGQVPGRGASPAPTLAPQMPAGEPGPPGVTEDDLAALRAAPEPGTVTRAAQSAPAPDMPPPATGRAAAQQVASAVRGGVERGFDITLSPAELGNVRITLTPADGGLSVSILADRPETLDLLRRHVADLAQEFRDIGYEDAEFSFGSEGQGAPRDGAAPGGARGAAAEDMPDGAASPQPADSAAAPDNGRMDIRI